MVVGGCVRILRSRLLRFQAELIQSTREHATDRLQALEAEMIVTASPPVCAERYHKLLAASPPQSKAEEGSPVESRAGSPERGEVPLD